MIRWVLLVALGSFGCGPSGALPKGPPPEYEDEPAGSATPPPPSASAAPAPAPEHAG